MRYLLAGESHGPALVGIIEGFPAGLPLKQSLVDGELARRLEGHGRGLRARQIEADQAVFLAGISRGRSLGTPIAFTIANRDHRSSKDHRAQRWTVPRPGHADLAGVARYGYSDCAEVAEGASARSTAAMTAVGACARQLLRRFGIEIFSHTVALADVRAAGRSVSLASLRRIRRGTPLRCLDRRAEKQMVAAVDAAQKEGTTLGGVFEVIAFGLPAGLGTYAQPDRRLDARLAGELMGIPGVKGVSFGDAMAVAERTGRQAHDEFNPPAVTSEDASSLPRLTNRAGGLEGGITNGMPLRVRGHVKPLASQHPGLRSVDLKTRRAARAPWVRSDVCVVPAAGVVGEAVLAWRLACELMTVVGETWLDRMLQRYAQWQAETGAVPPVHKRRS